MFSFFKNSESGHAYVELALVLPILALLSYGGLEYSRSLKYVQIATMISREAAGTAFRNCVVKADPDFYETASEQRLEVESCLAKVRRSLESAGEERFTGASLLLSVYRYDGPQDTCNANVTQVAIVGEGDYKSQFGVKAEGKDGAISGPDTIRFDKQVLCDNRYLVISEVFLPYSTIVKLIPGYFTYNPTEFYGVAIM